jgi:hypothetical protein
MGGPAIVKGGVSTGAAWSGAVTVTGAAAAAGDAPGVAVTGIAVEVAEPGRGEIGGAGANGGVAVEGMGIAGRAAGIESCEVITLELPGGTATASASVVGASARWRAAAAWAALARRRAAAACTLFGSNAGGSVGFLT